MTARIGDALKLLTTHSGACVGAGVSEDAISSAESALGIRFPAEYAEYLRRLNYAELHGDPLFGIHEDPGLDWCDVVEQNKEPPFAVPGYLAFFRSDLDGVCYIDLGSGEVFRADFAAPAWGSLAECIVDIVGA
ncbi:MAG: SMI1/KNR4 family protein [Planctomycetes bacterium]|nr:SMI1/KNR4 family protein [Planctomycetota bacterium]